ncbi:MAG: adenine nucleotide alpha hydrolase [Planctomycetes bacterium]|nr:adenine nucleotide alpha hydrolase [Planctomycetota bacterium]
MKRVCLSWSGGKDCAWALMRLRDDPDVEVVKLLTTLDNDYDRINMTTITRRLLRDQAGAVGLPVREVDLPSPCSNEEYASIMGKVTEGLKLKGITHVAFGDLYLQDVREYREKNLQGTGLEPLFPNWKLDTKQLSREMVDNGLKAYIVSVDEKKLTPDFVGREYDARFLDELPKGVDPCGENGEFHSFAFAGPMFHREISVQPGQRFERNGFWYADVYPDD